MFNKTRVLLRREIVFYNYFRQSHFAYFFRGKEKDYYVYPLTDLGKNILNNDCFILKVPKTNINEMAIDKLIEDLNDIVYLNPGFGK